MRYRVTIYGKNSFNEKHKYEIYDKIENKIVKTDYADSQEDARTAAQRYVAELEADPIEIFEL